MKKYHDTITDVSGRSISGASVTVYATGTQTKATLYSDNGSTQTTNPVTTGSLGYFEFYVADGRYDITISGTGITTRTITDVLIEDAATTADLTASTGSSLVGHIASGAGAVATTVREKLRETVSVKDFGAVGNGVANDTAAFQAAAAHGARTFVPAGSYSLTTNVTGNWRFDPGAYFPGAGRAINSVVDLNRAGAENNNTRFIDARMYVYGDVTATQDGVSAVNSIFIAGDEMEASHSEPISGFQVVHAVGGGSASGSRSAIHSRIAVTGVVADEFLSDMVSHLATGYSMANQGGDGVITSDIDDGFAGGVWGQNINVWLASGATHYREIYGTEVNVSINSGASAYAKAGVFITKLAADASRAVADDAAILLGAADNSVTTWKKGIQFGASWGLWPFASDSELIGVQNIVYPTPGGAMAANYGVNFSGVAFSTAAFASNGFSVDGSGNVDTAAVRAYNVTGGNYERFALKFSANVAFLEMEKAGTGTSRNIALKTGTAQWNFQTDGALVIPNYLWFNGGGGSRLFSPANGNIALYNSAANDFGLLQFGGVTNSFPALKRSATTIQARLADDSGFADFQSRSLIVSDGMAAPSATVGVAKIYVDTADGDLKVIFGDGTIKTIVTDA
jgi:hypothetical protein